MEEIRAYPLPGPSRHLPWAGAEQPARSALGIEAVALAGGRADVTTRDLDAGPFHALVAHDCPDRPAEGTVLLVPPISGQLPLVLRDMVIGLLPRFRVLMLDWVNPRHVPLFFGGFGFADNVGAIRAALRLAGPGTHLLGLCQSGVPSLAAAALEAEGGGEAGAEAGVEGAVPASLTLLGSPVDPMAAPTALVRRLRATPLPWLKRLALAPVPFPYPGQGRRVYPAATQLAALGTYLFRQARGTGEIARKLRHDDGSDPIGFPFLDLYTSVVDIEGQHFVENISLTFQLCALAEGILTIDGTRVRPEALHRTALLTVEGSEDDIAAPGQTAAAHRLCRNVPGRKQRALLVPGAGHFSLFHGDRFRGGVLPHLLAFLRKAT